MTKMHKYLTGPSKYKGDLPFYVENLFTDKQVKDLKNILNINRTLEPVIIGDRIEDGYIRNSNFISRYQPKIAKSMSRMLLEFEMPKDCEEVLDKIAKPLYDEDIALCHYNYIDYNLKYGYGDNDPSLPPHIDADENLVTINYCLDSNIEWDLYVTDLNNSMICKRYTLSPGQAIIFSAVNQIHWRPKRVFKEGEFCEIISMDYCPTTNYRFTGEHNPIDPEKYTQARVDYINQLVSRQDMRNAFSIWEKEEIKNLKKNGEV